MDVKELEVRVPFERLADVARFCGGEDIDLCPPNHDLCFAQRNLAPYLKESIENPVDNECTECWLRYIMIGD